MPETIFSSVLLPLPFRPIKPRLSPRRSSKLTSSSTCSRSCGRRRNRSSACSRTVSRRTDGIVNVFETPARLSMTRPSSQVLRHARRAAAINQRADPQDDHRFERQEPVRQRADGTWPSTSTLRENRMTGVGGQRYR